MGTAILAGVPRGYIDDLRASASKLDADLAEWGLKFIPAPRNDVEIVPKMMSEILQLASKYDDSHVFGFSNQKDRQEIASRIRMYFRFRWFRHDLLRNLKGADHSPFLDELSNALREESEWATRVKPTNLDSPLLLPECSFAADRRHAALWRNSLAFGDAQNIAGAEKSISEFNTTHFRKIEKADHRTYKWLDKDGRVFDQNGPRHGDAPFPRAWKFSYRIEDGFHYDVSHVDEKAFTLVDITGQRTSVKRGDYLNVDPHGYIR